MPNSSSCAISSEERYEKDKAPNLLEIAFLNYDSYQKDEGGLANVDFATFVDLLSPAAVLEEKYRGLFSLSTEVPTADKAKVARLENERQGKPEMDDMSVCR